MKFKTKTAILLILLMFFCTSMLVFAGGNGEGGNKNPFSLDVSQPLDGEKDIEVDSEIHLTFTKNVVNILVNEKNKTCFKLLDEDKQDVPIEIIMADDQIERDKKRDVILKPKSLLKESTEYTVIIDAQLESKSGQVLGENVALTFRTVSANNSILSQKWVWTIGAVIILLVIIIAQAKKKR